MKNIRLLKGMKIGHADIDGRSGVSVIIAPPETVGGVCVRGGAPGTRETELLRSDKSMQHIDAVVFSGGSAFGLSTADGVMRYLARLKRGVKVGAARIPLVPAAVIFDLNNDGGRNTLVFPKANLGYKACANAKESGIEFGLVGAGAGATVGKMLGQKFAHKGGIGAYTVELGDVFVTAVAVVNALGDVRCKTGQILAGAQDEDGIFLDTKHLILSGDIRQFMTSKTQIGANTTLAAVITNAKLDKLAANKLASIAHNGFASVIAPVHTDYDGDAVFVLSKSEGEGSEFDFTALSTMAVEATSNAIISAVAPWYFGEEYEYKSAAIAVAPIEQTISFDEEQSGELDEQEQAQEELKHTEQEGDGTLEKFESEYVEQEQEEFVQYEQYAEADEQQADSHETKDGGVYYGEQYYNEQEQQDVEYDNPSEENA